MQVWNLIQGQTQADSQSSLARQSGLIDKIQIHWENLATLLKNKVVDHSGWCLLLACTICFSGYCFRFIWQTTYFLKSNRYNKSEYKKVSPHPPPR